VELYGIKGFVIPTKSFVKIGITEIFCYNNKMLFLSTKRLVAAAKFLVAATKKLFVDPNFAAVTKPFFFVLKRCYIIQDPHCPSSLGEYQLSQREPSSYIIAA